MMMKMMTWLYDGVVFEAHCLQMNHYPVYVLKMGDHVYLKIH